MRLATSSQPLSLCAVLAGQRRSPPLSHGSAPTRRPSSLALRSLWTVGGWRLAREVPSVAGKCCRQERVHTVRTAVAALQMLIRFDGLALIVLGTLFWTGNAL